MDYAANILRKKSDNKIYYGLQILGIVVVLGTFFYSAYLNGTNSNEPRLVLYILAMIGMVLFIVFGAIRKTTEQVIEFSQEDKLNKMFREFNSLPVGETYTVTGLDEDTAERFYNRLSDLYEPDQYEDNESNPGFDVVSVRKLGPKSTEASDDALGRGTTETFG